MKKFNFGTFFVSTVLIGFLLVLSFVAAAAEDEGTLGTNIIWAIFARLFYILRFPTHTLFWSLFSRSGGVYLLGLLINCVLYGLLIERVSYLFKKLRSQYADKNQMIS